MPQGRVKFPYQVQHRLLSNFSLNNQGYECFWQRDKAFPILSDTKLPSIKKEKP